MTTQQRPSGPSRPHKAAPAQPHRRLEQVLIALVVVVAGLAIFRAILLAADDAMLALLGPVVVFLSVASLFAGDTRRRL